MNNYNQDIDSKNIQLVVSASDLETVIKNIVTETMGEIAAASKDAKLTRIATLKRLGKSEATLWRWERSGYLKPIRQGKEVFYRESDIRAIEEGRR